MEENKKYSAAAGKPRMYAVPQVALWALGAAMADGAKKYGQFNWRANDVDLAIFIDALKRHISAFEEGEDFAQDSKIHHLAHVMAGCAIMLDAFYTGVVKDNRHPTGKDPVYDGVEVYRQPE